MSSRPECVIYLDPVSSNQKMPRIFLCGRHLPHKCVEAHLVSITGATIKLNKHKNIVKVCVVLAEGVIHSGPCLAHAGFDYKKKNTAIPDNERILLFRLLLESLSAKCETVGGVLFVL